MKILLIVLITALVTYLLVTYQPKENKYRYSNASQNIHYTSGKKKEKDYVELYCRGIKEATLPDRTRVDCIDGEYAIEFDWAKKWAESIGQSLYYAMMTGKKPAVALIMTSPKDEKYAQRIEKVDKNIKIFRIKDY